MKVVLTVVLIFDDGPEASQLLNLAALCQKSHNGHDSKARRQRRHERLDAVNGQAMLFRGGRREMSEGWLVECQRSIRGTKSKTRAAFVTYEKAMAYATPWLKAGAGR